MRSANMSQFPWCAFLRDDQGNILEVVLPSYNHLAFLSPDIEMCPSLYCNPRLWDHEFNVRVRLFKHLSVVTQETSVGSQNPWNDLTTYEAGWFNAPPNKTVH